MPLPRPKTSRSRQPSPLLAHCHDDRKPAGDCALAGFSGSWPWGRWRRDRGATAVLGDLVAILVAMAWVLPGPTSRGGDTTPRGVFLCTLTYHFKADIRHMPNIGHVRLAFGNIWGIFCPAAGIHLPASLAQEEPTASPAASAPCRLCRCVVRNCHFVTPVADACSPS